jgi:hypothetical protein
MSIHKSLIVSCALILAFTCTGILAASAHTIQADHARQTIKTYPHGIPAIPALSRNRNMLSFLDVKRYIQSKGFVGGPTLSGLAPTLQALQLTNVVHVYSLLHSLLPRQLGDEQVYYAHLAGPFLVLPDLPLPVLSTLLPSLSNIPAFLPHLANLSSTGLTNILPLSSTMPDLSHLQSSALAGHHKNATVLSNAYEIFDAHNGNLLAWG